eukprot:TRINITY_DN672_c2_g1_i1.p1 TRINITY_DN672_c2_g1~~TRINITY_DN672_c2_g1_i1.p1  ORF type:complete len:480 (+),score=99.33 TRINITY_DN672_c2_g1_i1:49-1440(+)
MFGGGKAKKRKGGKGNGQGDGMTGRGNIGGMYSGVQARGVMSTLQMGLEALDPTPFVQLFNNVNGTAEKLWKESGAGSAEELAGKLSPWCIGPHKKIAALVGCFTQGVVESNHDIAKAHNLMLTAVKNLNQYLGDCSSDNCEKPSWMVEMLGPILNRTRRIAYLYEQQEGKRGKRMDEVTSALQTSLSKLGSDRTPNIADSKKRGMVTLCNNLSKAAFHTNNMGVIKPSMQMLSREIEKSSKDGTKSPLDLTTQGQRVTHLFYSGRVSMLEQRFNEAEEDLKAAFKLCHTSYRKNQIRILVFLVTVKLVQGKFPSSELLAEYGLTAIFQPLVEAIQVGNTHQFDKAIEDNASFFAKLGIYVILHRARMMCFLNLTRRVHYCLVSLKPGDATFSSRVKMAQLTAAYETANNGKTISPDEIECALVCLIANGQIKGYISRQHQTVVLSKGNPFPGCNTFTGVKEI